MTQGQLAEIVDRVRRESVTTTVVRGVDTAAEEMARELMGDPEFRSEMQALLRAAFRRAAGELSMPAAGE